MGTDRQVRLSSSPRIRCQRNADITHPSITSKASLKCIRFERFPPIQEYLDLISSHLPDIEIIICTDQDCNAEQNDARQLTSFTFNLTAFEKLKSFRMDIQSVVEVNYREKKKAFDYLLLQFKYSINGEEGFYSVHEEEPYCYTLTTTTQQIYLGFFAEQKS